MDKKNILIGHLLSPSSPAAPIGVIGGEIFMIKWPVYGSAADWAEGVLQNERENSGLAGGGVFEVREEFCYFTNRFQSNVPQNSVE